MDTRWRRSRPEAPNIYSSGPKTSGGCQRIQQTCNLFKVPRRGSIGPRVIGKDLDGVGTDAGW